MFNVHGTHKPTKPLKGFDAAKQCNKHPKASRALPVTQHDTSAGVKLIHTPLV